MRGPAVAVAPSRSSVVLDGLPREVAAVIRRHPLAAVAPAALLGGGADLIVLVRHEIGAEIALGILLALLFELYVGYAELIVAADRRDEHRVPIRRLLRRALPLTPALVLASVVGVSVPLAATGLLVIPGLWLLTVWSLFAPAVVHERLGPTDSLRRSRQLVRGAFWAVALTVSVSIVVEHAVIHGTAHSAEPVLGSYALSLLVAAVATAIVSPPAAFTISIVYERLERAVTR